MSAFQTQSTTQSVATQGGTGTEPTTMMISGVKVNFPCKPYPSQMAMMSKVITGLKTQKNCLLESPTGSGKSLALLCAALAWQSHEAARVAQYNAEIDARQEAAQAKAKMEQKSKKKPVRESLQKYQAGVQKSVSEPNTSTTTNGANETTAHPDSDSSIDVSMNTSAAAPPVFDITDDDDDDDFKPTKRSRISASSLMDKSNYTSDDGSDSEAKVVANTKEKRETEDADVEDESPYFVPPEKKLTVPKIFFGTRTHKQIAQITRELRKTSYANVRSVILASRDHTCINPVVEKLSNKNDACRDLLQNSSISGNGCVYHGGARKMGSFGALSAAGINPSYDLEDLVLAGRRHKACPYYTTRFLMQSADIIFCPYNYIIDPAVRKSMQLEMDGHVLIFDEAHNMEDASREASSFSLKQDEISAAMKDCEKVGRCGTEPHAHADLAELLSKVSRWMDMQSAHLKEKSFNSSGKCWNGTDFLGSVYAHEMDDHAIRHYSICFKGIMEQRDQQMESMKERGLRFSDEKPVLSTTSVKVIESVFGLFTELTRNDGRYRDDFRVALSKETVKQRRDGNSGPFRTTQVLSIHLWCLNPAVAFEDIRKAVHSVVLTSGTLSPMQSFESELGTPFPLKLEASHVIDKNQVWAGVLGVGPTGVSLNGSYQNVETLTYQDELGTIVHKVCEIIPHGVLCFFPSYRMLESVTNRWRVTGLMDKIESIKAVVMEPRSGTEAFQDAMNIFYDAIEISTRTAGNSEQAGALFFAVCRGKVSEGLDFADNNARAVICIGIPFPNVKDMQVELKREYNSRNLSRGLLNGGEWYEIQAFRALNQALGRCIRHRNDWGAILLIDERYQRTPRYVSCLSKWIRSSIMNLPSWPSVTGSLEQFRDGMLALNYPLTTDENTAAETGSESTTSFVHGPHGATTMTKRELWATGMNKDKQTSYGRSSTTVIPFAHSSSSCGNICGDSDVSDFPDDTLVNLKSESDTNDSLNQSVNNPNSFKVPTTPSNIFARKSNIKKPNMIASMFARQVEKSASGVRAIAEGKFNPNQISFTTSTTNVPAHGSPNTKKRGRDKKLKL